MIKCRRVYQFTDITTVPPLALDYAVAGTGAEGVRVE